MLREDYVSGTKSESDRVGRWDLVVAFKVLPLPSGIAKVRSSTVKLSICTHTSYISLVRLFELFLSIAIENIIHDEMNDRALESYL